MNADWLIHPPGGLPEAAPKGLVDLWVNMPPSAAGQLQQAVTTTVHAHSGLIVAIGVLAIALGWAGFYLWRDWRGIVLRWQIRRLERLMARKPDALPEPVGAALMWALARYFSMRPAVDRRVLPSAWQVHIAALDALRFGNPPQVDMVAWQALLVAMSARTRTSDSVHDRESGEAVSS